MNDLMKTYLCRRIKQVQRIKKIHKEASGRDYYRLFFEHGTLVAMVFPEENREEISNIVRFTDLFSKNHIPVPEIVEVIENRIVLQEDLGDQSVQKRFSKVNVEAKKKIIDDVARMLRHLKGISVRNTEAILNREKMIREMDFFLDHFAVNFFRHGYSLKTLQDEIYGVVDCIREVSTFAHRDFHSRNMLFYRDRIHLIDFQDALIACPYYDLVSFAFDSYLDLKSLRKYLFHKVENVTGDIQKDQLFLTALQRNIKALGTFGFQVSEKRNLSYRKYIRRTIRHLHHNMMANLQIPTLLDCFKRIDL